MLLLLDFGNSSDSTNKEFTLIYKGTKDFRHMHICTFAHLHLNLITSSLYISAHLQRSTNYADYSKAILAEKIEGFSLTHFQNYVKILSNSKKGLMRPKESI